MNTKISEILDIEPHEVETNISTEIVPVNENVEDSDFDIVRQNQYELLEQGKAAVNTAMRIAAESENPRAIEVLAGLLKNVSEMNKQLLTLSKDKADIKTAKRGNGQQVLHPQNNIQNAVFVGNGSELNKLLAEKLKPQV